MINAEKLQVKGCGKLSVITESILRKELKNFDKYEYEIEKGVIVTPSAKQYLKDRNINIVYKEEKVKEAINESVEKVNDDFKPKYVHINGGSFEKKPEHMTQLYGNKLVEKDNKRIIFRGKIDSLQAKILETEVLCKELKEIKILNDLEDVLKFVRNILACEVTEKEFDFKTLIGLNSDELREYSHNPKKYLNSDHIIFPSAEMGSMVVALNALRAGSREVEISAYEAFKGMSGEHERADLALALNRLSSCFYIMMCKCTTGTYK